MKNAILATIELEGQPETVSVFYEKRGLGDPEITDVILNSRSVLHLVEPSALKMRRLRVEVMKVLGNRSFNDYQREVLAGLTGNSSHRTGCI